VGKNQVQQKDRRSTDECKLELIALVKQQEDMQKDVSAIKQRVFNGFGTAIEATQANLEMVRVNNLREHDLMNAGLAKVESKIDKLFWLIFSAIGVTITGTVLAKLFGG